MTFKELTRRVHINAVEKGRCKEDRAMKITVELPDNTGTGFSNFLFGEVFGDAFGLSLGTISLDSERIKNREATYKSRLKNDTEPKEVAR